MTSLRRLLPLTFALLVLLPSAALAAGVHVRFDGSSPSGRPFPSDVFTVRDRTHLTGVRVNLPKPNCATFPSDCADIDVLNTLDGFNLQPRISIPFTGPIDPASVNSSNVFLVSLGSTTRGAHDGKVVGINQIVWEPATNTLHAESDELLDQHTRYALVVTDGVRDTDGRRVKGETFEDFLGDGKHKHHHGGGLGDYRGDLREALDRVELHGH